MDSNNSSSSETTESENEGEQPTDERLSKFGSKSKKFNLKRGFHLSKNTFIHSSNKADQARTFVNLDKRSLFCFSNKSTFRLWCFNIQTYQFENLILAVIILNSICLAIYDYSERDLLLNSYLDYIMMFFTLVFLFEVVTKIVAFGFFLDKKSFFWQGPIQNSLDLIIVIAGLIEIINKYRTSSVLGDSTGLFKVLRVFRTIRPLASI